MCGITGFIDFEDDLTQKKPLLEKMTMTLSRRGPDDVGYRLFSHAAFGHRRLIVVDPAGGGQPMEREIHGRKCCITYNGELYNTDELRKELLGMGYSFTSRSDTEVLLVSYIAWGENCVDRLNGIFAFGIWDEAGQKLFMARDRLGVKPLFYAKRGTSFIFGSEIKALLAHPLVNPELDATGLAEIFALGPARTPGCGVFRGIEELKPGYALSHDSRGTRIRQYWALESRVHEDDIDATVQKVSFLIKDTVKRQLVSDVPVCTLLSGGLDSSAVTALVSDVYASVGQKTLSTFSVDYAGNDIYFKASEFQPNSDSYYVQKVSACLHTDHHLVIIRNADLAEALDDAVMARDLPGMADVDSSLYLFCREVKREATVALSGEGADEIFGGYPWFRRPDDFSSDTFPWTRMMQMRSKILSPELIDSIKPEEYVKNRYREALDEVPRLAGENAFDRRIREITYLSITRFMPTLLDRKDRMSMYTGLEVRVPYCDHRLVQYVWNIPWQMRSCGNMEKGLLRKAMEGILPQDVLYRKKSPYPKTHNPEYLAIVRNRMLEILNDPASPLLPFINKEAVNELAASDASSLDIPWFGQLMTTPQLLAYLVQTDFWMRKYGVTVA
ncbi:MAG: asparagine synthase (glutamine-hydrolyzing) [Tepidanaerobacteraceae bacterium]|nr:asparagine synthase (glutamine-hydrolyzing) [Tepidanaerobacteraceae bacterium]